MIQVSQQFALFGREVTVTTKINFAFASKRRHFAERTHSLSTLGWRVDERTDWLSALLVAADSAVSGNAGK